MIPSKATRAPDLTRLAGAAVGVALRLAMAAMLRDVLRAAPDDHRFVGKGIASRGSLMVPAASLAVPLAWAATRRRGPYPVWVDDLLLSIVAVDLAGNVFDLYDRYLHFDLIPHAHGSGALTVVIAAATGRPVMEAAMLATGGHLVLEGQEIASDVLFGYRNVRAWWDSPGDVAAGVLGTLVYGLAYEHLVRRAGREPAPLFDLA